MVGCGRLSLSFSRGLALLMKKNMPAVNMPDVVAWRDREQGKNDQRVRS